MSTWTRAAAVPNTYIRANVASIENGNKILYSTEYRFNNQELNGIFQYDVKTNKHKLLCSCQDLKYSPIFHSYIFNKTQQAMIFVGGKNMGFADIDKPYLYGISIYNIKKQTMQRIKVDHIFGTVPSLFLTNNDRYLHIIGGQPNNYHSIYDFTKHKFYHIACFENTHHSRSNGHIVIHDKFKNILLLFGGYSFECKQRLNDCYMLNLNHLSCLLSLDQCSKLLVDGFMKQIDKNYPNALTNIIELYLAYQQFPYSQWTPCVKYKLLRKMSRFGHVLYDDRIVITFGGWIKSVNGNQKHDAIDDIYYLDITCDAGWTKSKLKCPKPGSYNAFIVNNNVHLIPRCENIKHVYIAIASILPDQLIKK